MELGQSLVWRSACIENVDAAMHFFSCLSAGNLAFEVDQKQAFEVPLKNVSNSNKGKNEVTLQLHQAEDAKVSLMEIRFYVPSGDGEGDAVEVKETRRSSLSEREKNNGFRLQDFHQNVLRGAAVLTAKAGDAICSLADINCLVPRSVRTATSSVDLRRSSFHSVVDTNCDSIRDSSIYTANRTITKFPTTKLRAAFFFRIKTIDKCISWFVDQRAIERRTANVASPMFFSSVWINPLSMVKHVINTSFSISRRKKK